MPSFLDSHKDFVLKLKIQTADQTQIRRVSLPRIADATGNISYEELVGLVLVFSLPEEDASRMNTSNYTVSLTYYDDEKDLITLASTEELKEAIQLFAGEGFVRITTSVKPKTTYSASPHSYSAATTKKGTESPQGPPIKAVLESFAGILSTAVNNLQEGLANESSASSGDDSQLKPPPPPPVQMPKEKAARMEARRGAILAARKEARQATSQKKRTATRARKSADMSTCTTSPASEESTIKLNPSTKEEPETKSTVGSTEKKNKSEAKPFIHGRHTCDGCLKSPIIGKRYHATNIPDYDLCQRCYGNYKGSEIKYEPVELRRDIAFQSRWRLRQERFMETRRQQSAQMTINRPSVPPRTSPARNSPPTNSSGTETDQNKADDNNANHVRLDNTSSSNDFDKALKEAIRRSLDDAAKKAKEDEKRREAEKLIAPETIICELRVTEAEEVVEKNIEKVTDSIARADDIRDTEKSVEQHLKNSQQQPIAFDETIKEPRELENAVPKKESSEAKNDIPRSVDVIENNLADVKGLRSSGTICENGSVSLEVETMQQAMDTDSVDSEKLVSEPSEGEVLPTNTDILAESPRSKGVDTSKNESFASDAVGNGDVAEVMGKTLDLVAGVISEMLEDSGEMVGVPHEILEESSQTVERSEEVEKSSENDEEAVELQSNSGELIVNADEVGSGADEEEDDADWSVVKSIGSNGTSESQKIGRAAGMLGSALFNSDMKSSAEGLGSNLIRSDSSFSIPSSVPTELGTVDSRAPAAPTPASKWASELQKLKELGFDDEECCIGALERVKADSKNNDIKMEYVVNQLLFLNS